MYSVPAKILYLQSYLTDFRKLRISSKMLRADICVESFRCAGILFCNGEFGTLRSENIWNFATFSLYTFPAKILYLQRYWTDFRKHRQSSKMLRVDICVESFRCAGILFCNGELGTLRIENIWNFDTFNLYTVPEKIPYLQRYWTDFRNLCLSSKMLSVGIWVETFQLHRCIKLLQWQGENFAHRQHLKFCHFQRVTLCQQKSCISKGIEPIFEIFDSARRCWGWAFGLIVSVTEVF